MISGTGYLIFAILILIISFAIIYMNYVNKGKKNKTDYYTLYLSGIIWMIIGIPLENHALFLIGIIFGTLGWFNRFKWKKNRKRLNDLNDKERKFRLWIIIGLSILVLIGVILFLIIGNRI